MEVKVLHMNGGEGETSYAKNSSLQMRIIQTARSAVEEAALELCSGSSSFPAKLSVADLGCSSGPNALSVVSVVVDAVEERCRQIGRRPPEFQLFLNDLPGNDFNSLFRSLQGFYRKREASAGGGEELGRCFVAGVPGSFHGRLFPSRSIDFFHSASSLHWLSQGYISEAMVDSFNMPCYAPCAAELEGIIQREGSFSIKHLETVEVVIFDAAPDQDGDHMSTTSQNGNINVVSDMAAGDITNSIRAIIESMLASHFGGDVMEDLFLRYRRVLEDLPIKEAKMMTNLVISLVREP